MYDSVVETFFNLLSFTSLSDGLSMVQYCCKCAAMLKRDVNKGKMTIEMFLG